MKRAKDPRIGNKVIIINGLLGVKCDSNHTPSSFTSRRFFRLKNKFIFKFGYHTIIARHEKHL
jgi:hypothetical protein